MKNDFSVFKFLTSLTVKKIFVDISHYCKIMTWRIMINLVYFIPYILQVILISTVKTLHTYTYNYIYCIIYIKRYFFPSKLS